MTRVVFIWNTIHIVWIHVNRRSREAKAISSLNHPNLCAVVNASNAYDVAADGRLQVHMPAGGTDAGVFQNRTVVVQNWFDELKARVPTPQR